MMNKSREEKEFKKVPYFIGAFVIVLVGTIFTILEIHFNGIENSLVNTPTLEASTTVFQKTVVEEQPTYQIGTEKSTQNVTQQSTEKQTEKATEKATEKTTEKPTKKPTESVKEEFTQMVITEPPTTIIQKEYHTVYVPVYPENSYGQSEPYIPQEVATAKPTSNTNNYITQYTEKDISISKSTLYLSTVNNEELEIIFPPGLSSKGIDWNLDNSSVIKFVSADFNTVVIAGCKKGTATIYAKPKGYSVTLQCTVIVTE